VVAEAGAEIHGRPRHRRAVVGTCVDASEQAYVAGRSDVRVPVALNLLPAVLGPLLVCLHLLAEPPGLVIRPPARLVDVGLELSLVRRDRCLDVRNGLVDLGAKPLEPVIR
jgi:hypothetical protein